MLVTSPSQWAGKQSRLIVAVADLCWRATSYRRRTWLRSGPQVDSASVIPG